MTAERALRRERLRRRLYTLVVAGLGLVVGVMARWVMGIDVEVAELGLGRFKARVRLPLALWLAGTRARFIMRASRARVRAQLRAFGAELVA